MQATEHMTMLAQNSERVMSYFKIAGFAMPLNTSQGRSNSSRIAFTKSDMCELMVIVTTSTQQNTSS